MENLDSVIQTINESIGFYGTELDRYIELKQEYKPIKGLIRNSDPTLENTEDMEFLLDVNTGVVIALLDLAVIFKNLIKTESKWEEIYFVKQTYLSIYESLKTFSSFQKKLKDIFNSDTAKSPQFLKILKQLRDFKKTYGYDTHLALIRNKAAGHIDNDFVIYHTLVSDLEKERAIFIIRDLLPILNQVQTLTTILVREEKQRLELQLANLNKKINEALNDIKLLLKTSTSE